MVRIARSMSPSPMSSKNALRNSFEGVWYLARCVRRISPYTGMGYVQRSTGNPRKPGGGVPYAKAL